MWYGRWGGGGLLYLPSRDGRLHFATKSRHCHDSHREWTCMISMRGVLSNNNNGTDEVKGGFKVQLHWYVHSVHCVQNLHRLQYYCNLTIIWEMCPFTCICLETLPSVLRVPSSQLGNLSLTCLHSFSLTLRYMFYFKMPSTARQKNLGKRWFEEKVHFNQGWNLVHLSQTKIPWLWTTFPDFSEVNSIRKTLS